MRWADSVSRLDADVHAAFKLPAVYSPQAGGKRSIEVNLRIKDVEVDNGNGGTIFTEMTEAVFNACDRQSIVRGDRFTCRGNEYVVTDISDKSDDKITAFVEKQ